MVFEDADAGIEAAPASGAHTVVVGGVHSPAADGLERLLAFEDLYAFYDAETQSIQLRF